MNNKLVFYTHNPFLSNIPEIYEENRPYDYLDNMFDIA